MPNSYTYNIDLGDFWRIYPTKTFLNTHRIEATFRQLTHLNSQNLMNFGPRWTNRTIRTETTLCSDLDHLDFHSSIYCFFI